MVSSMLTTVVVISALRPTTLNVLPNSGVNDHLGRNVLAEVKHLISVVFQQDLDDILADVVDVALDRRKDDLALGLLTPRPSSRP